MIAGEAGHVEIVDILRNSADSGIMDEGEGKLKDFCTDTLFVNG